MDRAAELFLRAAEELEARSTSQWVTAMEYVVELYAPSPEAEARLAAESSAARAEEEAAMKEAAAAHKSASTVEFWGAFLRATDEQVVNFLARSESEARGACKASAPMCGGTGAGAAGMGVESRRDTGTKF